MSEKIYALLFRLFPARFRAHWQADALDLVRQRAEHEPGLLPRLRLWLDLIADLAFSLPRAWLADDPGLVPAAQPQRNAIPSFNLLEEKPIGSSAYLYGTLLSLTILAGISLLARHAGHFPILHASSTAEASGVTVDPWLTGNPAGDGSGNTPVLGNGPASTQPQRASSGNPSRLVARSNDATRLVFFDGNERRRVVDGLAANLSRHYSDPALAKQLAQTFQTRERSGDYDSVDDPRAFAALLTQQLRAASRDNHFEVIYSQTPLREYTPSAADTRAYGVVMRQANCTFEDVRILPGNIGYLKLDTFPDPEVCGDIAIAAMKTLSRADALIIDLRENSGGSPAMVLFLASWLFDRPAFFWTPRENSAASMYTHSPMAGSGLADKPVCVLTSSRTFSAAEHFSYNLKMLHRATLIGETTAGATDVGVFHRIDEHFGIGMRESKVANPYPTPDWAVNGVQPDIAVPASAALTKAEDVVTHQLAHR